jgi:hypothetical protein
MKKEGRGGKRKWWWLLRGTDREGEEKRKRFEVKERER